MKTWIHRYPFVLPLLALVVGIYSYQWLQPIGISVWVVVSIIHAVVAILLHRLKIIDTMRSLGRMVVINGLFAQLGLGMSYWTDVRNEVQYYGKQLSDFTEYIAVINEPPSVKEKITIYQVSILSIRVNGQWQPASGKAIVNIYNDEAMPALQQQDLIVLPNKLSSITHSGNPFAFDFAAFQQHKGKYYQQFSSYKDVLLHKRQDLGTQPIANSKQHIQRLIQKEISDSTTSSLLQAIIVNERQTLDKDLWQTYSKTGIVHIIAISGMHIGIFFSAVYFLLFWIRQKRYEWIKCIIALPLIWLYIALTGYPPSAVRAGVMISILMIGIMINRKNVPINTLLATAFVLLVLFPNWLYDVGFQLSFVSVLSILIFYPPIRKWYQPPNIVLKYLWNILAVSIAVQPLIFPLILYYFHQFPVFGIIANIPASIYSILFMVGGMLLIILGSLGVSVSWLASFLIYITKLFNQIIAYIGSISPDFFYNFHIDAVSFWLLSALVVAVCYYAFFQSTIQWRISVMLLLSLGIYQSYIIINRERQERLVVYNVYGKSLVQYIIGSTATEIRDDKVLEKEEKLFLQPSKIGHGITKTINGNDSTSIWNIDNQKVLVVHRGLIVDDTMHPFPVDILVINKSSSKHLPQLIQTFRPKKIVADGSIRNYDIEALESAISNLAIAAHFVVRDGAFILD